MTEKSPITPRKKVGVYKIRAIPRITSDKILDIFKLNLKKGNVVIIDGLKYRFDGKNRFIIDKNAKKSADAQGKEYRDIIELPDNSVHSGKYINMKGNKLGGVENEEVEELKDEEQKYEIVDKEVEEVNNEVEEVNNEVEEVNNEVEEVNNEVEEVNNEVEVLKDEEYNKKEETKDNDDLNEGKVQEPSFWSKIAMKIPWIKSLKEKREKKDKMRIEKERREKIRNGEVKELNDKEKLIKKAVEWWSPRKDSTYDIASTEDPMFDAIRMFARSNRKEPSETQIKNFEIELAYEISKELERVYKDSDGQKNYCYIETDWHPGWILSSVVQRTGISELSFSEKHVMKIDLLGKEVTYRYKFDAEIETLIKL